MANQAPQARHIVIAVDGTKRNGDGSVDIRERTNVYRANLCILNSGLSDVDISYVRGVGVDGWFGRRKFEQAFGSGIDRQICDAYTKLCRAYPSSEDKIILIGYSRGAFAVRCLLDIIFKFGILSTVDPDQRPMSVFEKWKAGMDGPRVESIPIDLSNVVCILWDTVGSVEKRLLQLIDSTTEGYGSNYHALALHERRKDYLPTVMKFTQAADLTRSEQCWFVGYHGDVGGGRKKNALGNIALAWALGKLSHHMLPNWTPLGVTDNAAGDNWRVHRSRVVFDIKDTFKGKFRVLGARSRYPKRQFWRGPVHETLSSTPEVYDYPTQETIHVTVRGLVEHIDPRPQGLKDARPPDSLRGWRLYGPNGFDVNEAVVSPVEKEGLRWWVSKNLRELQRVAELGQQPPGTVVADLMHAIRGD